MAFKHDCTPSGAQPQNKTCFNHSAELSAKQPAQSNSGNSTGHYPGCKSTATAVSHANGQQNRCNSVGKTPCGSMPISKAASKLYHGSADTDPQGSYTGRPASLDEVPVQDADDL